MLKEDTQTKIGLSCLKNSSPVEKQRTKSHKTPKELKISDLMRRRTV
jgi:hypothetical protein